MRFHIDIDTKVAIVLIVLSFSTLIAKDIFVFAPLPMEKSEKIIRESEAFLGYLGEVTSSEFQTLYSANYDTLIENFLAQKIDFAYLGPLPYAVLKSKYNEVTPLVKFKEKSGLASYSCTLFVKDSLKYRDISELKGRRVALTQELSTCGYFMSKVMLNELSLSLDNDLNYFYANSHSNVILSLLLGEADIGACKSEILDSYAHFGFRALYVSEQLPGFILVANNKSVSLEMMERVREALIYANSSGLVDISSWGEGMESGALAVESGDFDTIFRALDLF